MSNRGTCTSCGGDLLWLRTARGKSMPVDAEPVAGGNLLINLERGTVEVVHREARLDALERGEKLHTSHFVTCAHAGSHRRRGGGR